MNPRLFLKSEIIRNTSVLITGTVIAQVISILLQPFLRRFFSAETFGIYSVYLSLVGIIAVVSTLRYEGAIVLPKKDRDCTNLVALSLLYSLSINLFVFLLILITGEKLLDFIGLPAGFSISILYLIPLGAFLMSVYQSFNYWLIRKKKYRQVSANKLIRRSVEGGAQILFAFARNPKGLIFSDIIGQVANSIAIIAQSTKYGFRSGQITISRLRSVSKIYSEFPRYNLIPAFMSTCSFFLPPILINKFYSAENAGYFDLSKLVLSIPLALIAASISNVLLQKIAERYNKRESFLSDMKPLLVGVAVICMAEFVIIIAWAPALFRTVFGSEWGFSGEISRILVWSFAFNFAVSSFSCIFISMRKIKLYSIWQFFYFLAIVSLVLFQKLEFIDFLKRYVVIEVVCYAVVAVLMVAIVIKYEREIKMRSVA